MNKYAEVKDFYCIHEFTEEIVTELLEHEYDDFYTTNIVANGELTKALIKLLLSIESEDVSFDIGSIDFKSIESDDYNKEYLLSISNDMEIWCEPAWQDNEYRTGYLDLEAESTYIFEDSDFEVLDSITSDAVTIFGFECED